MHRIGIIGAGWRARTIAGVARALPDRFVVQAVMSTRAVGSGSPFAGTIRATDVDGFLAAGPFDFVVIAVPASAVAPLLLACVERGAPVLVETPPAPTVALLDELRAALPPSARVQVAEQYVHQPQHAARIAVVRSGLLGRVGSVDVSVAHGYHGMSLIRALLGIGGDEAELIGVSRPDPVVETVGRSGAVTGGRAVRNERITGLIEFPSTGQYASFDFSGEQYFSTIRSRHVVVRGQSGEITDDRVRRLVDGAAVVTDLTRRETGRDGDLEGYCLQTIRLGDRLVWENPFQPARLSDDEVAVGEVLRRMGRYADGGEGSYALEDARHDLRLAEALQLAVAEQRRVRSSPAAGRS